MYANSKYRYWTAEEIELLKEYRASGMGNQECAKMLKRSITSVRAKVFVLGISNKQWSEKEIELLKECKVLDKSHEEYTTALKRSKSAIENKARRLGISSHKNRWWTQKEILFLTECLNAKMTYSQCAEKLNRTERAVYSLIQCLKRQEILHVFKGMPSKLSAKEQMKACLNCTLPECVNCFGTKKFWTRWEGK